MKILQLIILSVVAITGCAKKADKPKQIVYSNPPAMDTTVKVNNTNPIFYLALGDSYTIGQSVSQDESFPYQLTAALKGEGFKTNPPIIIATTGWTTDNLIDAIATSNVKTAHYDFVTLLIGVNDQYQGLSKDNYSKKFAAVLQTAIKIAWGDPSRVFVLSIPDYGVTPFAAGQDGVIGPDIDAFNSINLQISNSAHVNYIDITDISREAAIDNTLIAPDGLHPSGKMYAEWVKKLVPFVTTRLNKN